MSDSSSSRSSSSPDIQYPELVQAHVSTSATNALGLAVQSQPYRSGPTSYQEQSQSANYPYVAPSPIPPPVIAANVELHGMNGTPYAYTQDFDAQVISHGNSPVQHHHHSMPSASSSPSMPAQLALPSRHSISHISHPQPHVYTDAHSSSAGNSPLSSTGSSSHHSHSQDAGPMGSAYPMFHGGAYRGGSGSTYRSELVQGGYTPGLAAQCADSPPPVLAPIQQDERMGGRAQQQQQHHVQEYLHHPQPSNTYQYYQSGLSALNHGNWKAEYTMRERGAIVQ
ncbi:hypothetical protein PLICRDRAFT_25334 [Plicaturopsis crispa FD-325 SS-3]|nr:hypothetical protein PLICRDRAFT_25334 [Plicaturopsis crispa FD-325 SS-3]